MTTKTPQFYDAEFKRNAASLYINGKQTLTELTEQLGVAESTLYNWVAEYRKKRAHSTLNYLSPNEFEAIWMQKMNDSYPIGNCPSEC